MTVSEGIVFQVPVRVEVQPGMNPREFEAALNSRRDLAVALPLNGILIGALTQLARS
jgi:hypothetical protein